jgi:hypothetical protein
MQLSFFTAGLPTLLDEVPERFFYHPTYPDIYCNQLGMLYYPEDKYVMSENRTIQYLIFKGTRARVAKRDVTIYQCFTGRVEKFSKMLFRNGNVNDFSIGNMITSRDSDKAEKKIIERTMQDFIAETIIDLYVLEKVWQTNYNTPPTELHDRLMLPTWVRNLSSIYVKEKVTKTGTRRGNGRGIVMLPNGRWKSIPYDPKTKIRKYLGIFGTEEEALAAVKAWKSQM